MTLTVAAEQILAWWQLGCVSSDRVTTWANDIIAATTDVADLPGWLFQLSLKGPGNFVAQHEPGFPQPKNLTYVERFRAMVEHYHDNAYHFAVWCARAAMGEDLSLEEVRVGYMIDHAFDYENSGDPVEVARDAVKKFRPHCHDMKEFWQRWSG